MFSYVVFIYLCAASHHSKIFFTFLRLITFQQYMYLAVVFLIAEGAYSLFYTSLYTSQFSNFLWKSC